MPVCGPLDGMKNMVWGFGFLNIPLLVHELLKLIPSPSPTETREEF